MSLIARYQFDGNARDSEGSAHGTAFDVTWGRSQLVDGGGEARLNGTTSRIETGIQFTSETAVSLAIWFRPRQGAGLLIGQHDGTEGLAIEQTETGKIRLVVNGTASAVVTVYPGEYHHAVAVYDDGEATLYLDNEAVASVSGTATWPAVPVTLGARADGSAALTCDVVDVRGYDQALVIRNIDQLNALINSGDLDPDWSMGALGGEVVWYSMDKVEGATLIDETGNHHGTIYGATQVPVGGGHVLEFNGVSDYVDFGQMLGFITQGGPFTVSARFRLLEPERRNIDYIFGCTTGGATAGFSLFGDNRRLSGGNATITTNRLRGQLSSGQGGSGSVVELHIGRENRSEVMTMQLRSDGSMVELLLDGVVVESAPIPATASLTNKVSAGEWLNPDPWGSGWAKMHLHEIRGYDRRLSGDECLAVCRVFDNVVRYSLPAATTGTSP